MGDGSNVQRHLGGVSAARGAFREPLDEAIAFLDPLEAPEERLGVELELVEPRIEASIENGGCRFGDDREDLQRRARR